MLIFVGGQ